MVEVAFSSSFRRTFKKIIKNNKSIEKRFWEKVNLFIQNPYHSQLRTHKLTGRLNELWSFTIEYDCRVLFYFSNAKKVVFIDIGTHEEVY